MTQPDRYEGIVAFDLDSDDPRCRRIDWREARRIDIANRIERLTPQIAKLSADIRKAYGDLHPAKIARRKRRGEGKRHCGPFKPDATTPEGEDTTQPAKAPENALPGDSTPKCGRSVTPETEQRP